MRKPDVPKVPTFETPEQKKAALENAKALAGATGGVPEGAKPKRINLSEIERNDIRQPRDGMNKNYVAELQEALTEGVSVPGVIVFSKDGRAPFFLADGWHRLEAHKVLGMKDIDAEIKTGSAFDAFRFSLGANTEHGLRRTNADKHRAVKLALESEEIGGMSDNAIGDICRVDRRLVAEIRKQVAPPESTGTNVHVDEESGESAPETNGAPAKKRVGKDGKARKPRTPSEEKQDEVKASVRKDIEWGKEMASHASVLHTTLTRNNSPYNKCPQWILRALVALNKSLKLELSEDKKSAVQTIPFPEA